MEKTILGNLLYNESFTRKVIPFLKDEYFSDTSSKVIYKIISDHLVKYNSQPTKEVLSIEIENLELKEKLHEEVIETIKSLDFDEKSDQTWLVENAEKWAQDRALYNAIMQAVKVYDGSETDMARGALPKLLDDALSVSFDTSIGHDYLEDWESRYDYYTRNVDRLEFDIDLLNKITDGGVFPKTLNLLVAPTGVGKSLVLCHLASSYLALGKNVLYITLEMSEEETSKRIDANLMGIDIQSIKTQTKFEYEKKIQRLRSKIPGKLIVEEYPTGAANVNHFRYLLNELKLKKKFRPDVIIIDYLNICSSSRLKGSNHNSYTIVKAIAEEVRGLAIEYSVPVWSATQTNRSGMNNSDYEIDSVSESMGIAHTCDLLLGIIRTEELDNLGQLMLKQLKNRYNDLNYYRRFVVGVDRAKMRLYNTENEAQTNASQTEDDDTSVFDNSDFGFQDEERNMKKNKFKNFKV